MEDDAKRRHQRRKASSRRQPGGPRKGARRGPQPSSSSTIETTEAASQDRQDGVQNSIQNISSIDGGGRISTAGSRPALTDPIPKDTPRFAELGKSGLVHAGLIQAITEDLGFNHMMPVQAATFDHLLPPKRRDCLVQAKTGTGKTVAFLLPALQTMITRGKAGISVLVISPTRELALQIAGEATSLLRRLPEYQVRTAIGGSNKDREERQILAGCDVLVATPGRLFDHMTSNQALLRGFRHLDTLVLDEADRLLDMGFMKALTDIVSCLPDKQETARQGMLFSATMAPHVAQVAGLVLSADYEFITTIRPGEPGTHQRVPQFGITVPNFASLAPAMVSCIRTELHRHPDFKAILFAPTTALAGFYGHLLSATQGLPPVSTLHSRISQNRRTKITNDYRDATSAVLVATDVVARGMDFPGVTTVLQVGIPADRQSYIHRLGRTARAGADGRGILILCEAEEWFRASALRDMHLLPYDDALTSVASVEALAEAMDEAERARVYQAWLGYYNNHLRGFGWDKEELVRQANRFARDGLACPETPALAKKTVGKMGLRGTRGLVVVPDMPKDNKKIKNINISNSKSNNRRSKKNSSNDTKTIAP